MKLDFKALEQLYGEALIAGHGKHERIKKLSPAQLRDLIDFNARGKFHRKTRQLQNVGVRKRKPKRESAH